MILIAAGTLVAYLLGSIPTAYIFGKLLKGIDVREHGSGNVGATNTLRAVGKLPALLVFLIDFAKGLVAVKVIPLFWEGHPPYFYVFLGIAAVAGHIWPVFLKFRGGKGVATLVGMMFGVNWMLGVLCALLVAVPALVTDYIVA